MSRLQEFYKEKVVGDLTTKFSYKSSMEVPRLLKITLNMGLSEAVADKKTGRPARRPDLKKPTALRGVVGVWNCEGSDRIKGRDFAYSTQLAPSQELAARG